MNEYQHKTMIGLPTADRKVDIDIINDIINCGAPSVLQVWVQSNLTYNFNRLMCIAYNNQQEHGLTHFLLHHADISVTTANWLAKMHDIMVRDKLDVLSVVSPIKSAEGKTSCAMDQDNGNLVCLKTEDIAKLPPTFTPADCKRVFGNDRLLINTGILLIRMDKVDPTKCWFEMVDRIVHSKDGTYICGNLPEDWGFSRMMKKHGIAYGATTEIELKHWGIMGWKNV